ncbi:short-chain collagen C4-like [Mytilus edulis]|uniref:short-chain collagen C4-like n=1 Tax=Mytilus edulis TaxID=6550 RepID=UPI0039EEA005
MWFLLQQISALSSTLEKVRDIADKSYKDISSLSRDFSDFKKVKESGDANDKLTELQTKFDKSQSKLEQLGKRIDKIGDQFSNIKNTGDNYIRWGRTSCPSGGTKLMYSGFMGGGYYKDPGGPARPICLPSQPNFLKTSGGGGAFVYGTEFQSGFFGPKAKYQDVPCAVCEVQAGSKTIMIPGRYKCYPGWKREYYGNLAAGYAKNNNHASAYICIDLKPEYIHGGNGGSNKANFLHDVVVRCGSLPCPPYHEGYPLPCVVCSK